MKKLLNAALVLVLCFGMAMPVLADNAPDLSTSAAGGGTEPIAKASSLVTIFVNAKSYFTLDEAAFTTSSAGKFAYFTWTFHNQDDYSFQMNDYFMRLANSAGTPFSVKLLPQDKDKNKVPAHGSVQLHYYAKVGDATGWNDLVVKLIKWDFSAEQFERTLWKFTIPQDYDWVTPLHTKRNIIINGSTLQAGMTEFIMNPTDDHSEAFLTLGLQNVGDQTLLLPGYSYTIQTQDGRAYPLQIANPQELHLSPLLQNEVQLVGALPKDVNTAECKLVITQNDDTLQLRIPVAVFMLPSSTEGVPLTLAGSSRTIEQPASGTSITMAVYKALMNQKDDYYHASIFYTIENIGHNSAAVPNYTYAIQTSEGSIYPLDPTVAKDLVIAPGVLKELQFDIAVPVSLKQSGWKLLITQVDTINKVTRPVAAYALPGFSDLNAGSIGADFAFKDAIGSFSVGLSALQRLPYDDQDIITAQIMLKNTGSKTAAIPQLQGYFLLDGGVRVEASLYAPDQAISLSVLASASSIMYAKIPFISSFSTIKLVLQEKDTAQIVHTIAEFNGTSNLLAIPAIPAGDPYQITDIGKTAELKLNNTHTYKGAENDLYYAEITLSNLEKRVVVGHNWIGYLKTSDGMYFPVVVTSPAARINPGSSTVMALWGILPSGIQMSQLKLLIGEAVTGAASSATNSLAVPIAYVKAAEMPLPSDIQTSQSLSSLQINPFTINMSSIKTQTTSANAFTFSFNYTLTKDANPTHMPTLPSGTNHKLVLQLSDSQGQNYEHLIPLDTTDGLNLGSSNFSFSQTDSDLMFLSKMQLAHQYTLKVYDEFLGFRLLLTTQTYNWNS